MPQRVLITAGAAGIGREFARAFAATGASVFVCDIDAKALEAIAKEIPGVIARRYDMARRVDIEHMVPVAAAISAGSTCSSTMPVSPARRAIADITPQELETTLRSQSRPPVPLRAARHTRAATRQAGGSIINLSSAAGSYGFAAAAPMPPPNGA